LGSVRRRGAHVRVTLEDAEVWLLLSMTTQLLALLGTDPAATPGTLAGDDLLADLEQSLEQVDPPDDPVLQRLLPDAYRDDVDAAQEFRRLTESELRATKRGGLGRLVSDLSAQRTGRGVRLDLDEDATAQWLAALTDLRLALGTRIGVTEDMDEERESLPVDSPRYAEISTYDWLSWLQDAMVRALTR
jgi:hypothetical protein